MSLASILLVSEFITKMEKGVVETIAYSILGIIMCVLAYKVVDWLTPGDMGKDIAQNKNLALAILAGSMILGICVIIAAAIAN